MGATVAAEGLPEASLEAPATMVAVQATTARIGPTKKPLEQRK